jgi:hypothetical protein
MMKLEEFRTKMAESGYEYTPEESATLYRMAIDFVKRARKISQSDLWQLMESDFSKDGISKEEQQALVELIQHARETC